MTLPTDGIRTNLDGGAGLPLPSNPNAHNLRPGSQKQTQLVGQTDKNAHPCNSQSHPFFSLKKHNCHHDIFISAVYIETPPCGYIIDVNLSFCHFTLIKFDELKSRTQRQPSFFLGLLQSMITDQMYTRLL